MRSSGAAVNIPAWPWLAVLDPDVTTSAQRGQYLVYLYSRDLSRLYLSVNQGVTAHRDAQGSTSRGANERACGELDAESEAVRANLSETVQQATIRRIDLGGDAFLPAAYAAGNVAAIEYEMTSLPSDDDLRADLELMLGVLDTAVAIKVALTLQEPAIFRTPVIPSGPFPTDELEFKPKDSTDYLANVPAQTGKRSRRHEALLRDYGKYLLGRGWTVGTNVHPRDLVARRPGEREVLCEVKTVGANAEHAVRAVIGQLFTYRHMCYPQPPQPLHLLGVFTGDIGEGFVELNESLGIMSVWREGRIWRGSKSAVHLGLAEM